MSTLIDTSAWVEYLRDTNSPVCNRVDELLSSGSPLATTDVVLMELLAGARSRREIADIEALLNLAAYIPLRPVLDYRRAASIWRACCREGFTPRQLTDCLVAAVAIAGGAAVLHFDRDYDRIAEHTELIVAEPA